MDILNEFEKYLKENYDSSGENNTIKSYLMDVKLFLDFFRDHFGETIVDFSSADYIEYKNYMIDKLQYKFSTINRKTASISIYENFLIEKKIRKTEGKIIKKKDFYKIEFGMALSHFERT